MRKKRRAMNNLKMASHVIQIADSIELARGKGGEILPNIKEAVVAALTFAALIAVMLIVNWHRL
jgi:hypothetical protein